MNSCIFDLSFGSFILNSKMIGSNTRVGEEETFSCTICLVFILIVNCFSDIYNGMKLLCVEQLLSEVWDANYNQDAATRVAIKLVQ